jgi:hypothetical protein
MNAAGVKCALPVNGWWWYRIIAHTGFVSSWCLSKGHFEISTLCLWNCTFGINRDVHHGVTAAHLWGVGQGGVNRGASGSHVGSLLPLEIGTYIQTKDAKQYMDRSSNIACH